MSNELKEDRLSQISTVWTEILQANCADADCRSESFVAQQRILSRYGSPIHRYLLAATRDSEVADELAQEFALRFIRGDLKNVSPQRGRFRDYLKTVLRNIVNDHFRRRNKDRFNPISDLLDENGIRKLDESFNEDWRQELLERAWTQLRDFETARKNHYYTVLRLRACQPELNSSDLADHLSDSLQQTVTPAWVRQNLKRARTKFCEMLIAEIASTLPPNSTHEDIESELASLRLLKYTVSEHVK
jgi:RNA polymerase sigma-70 factor (ECF subfamily)